MKASGLEANVVEINEHILLTGAGFTYDFGGFLAKDMWGMIFNIASATKYLN